MKKKIKQNIETPKKANSNELELEVLGSLRPITSAVINKIHEFHEFPLYFLIKRLRNSRKSSF